MKKRIIAFVFWKDGDCFVSNQDTLERARLQEEAENPCNPEDIVAHVLFGEESSESGAVYADDGSMFAEMASLAHTLEVPYGQSGVSRSMTEVEAFVAAIFAAGVKYGQRRMAAAIADGPEFPEHSKTS